MVTIAVWMVLSLLPKKSHWRTIRPRQRSVSELKASHIRTTLIYVATQHQIQTSSNNRSLWQTKANTRSLSRSAKSFAASANIRLLSCASELCLIYAHSIWRRQTKVRVTGAIEIRGPGYTRELLAIFQLEVSSCDTWLRCVHDVMMLHEFSLHERKSRINARQWCGQS